MVEIRECRIWPCTSLGLAPASTIQVACEVRKQRQLIQGRPSLRAAGLIFNDYFDACVADDSAAVCETKVDFFEK